MKKNPTPLDDFVGDRVTTTMLLRPRAGDFEQLRSLVTGDHANRMEMIADLRQRVVKALKEVNATTPEGTYAAFMLGANMNHIFGKEFAVFENVIGTSFGIIGAYFYQGYLGSPFRKIMKPELIYGKLTKKSASSVKKTRKSPSLVKPTSRLAKAGTSRRILEQAKKVSRRSARNESAGFDQQGSSEAQIFPGE